MDKDKLILSDRLRGIIVGLLLGDGHMRLNHKPKTCALSFLQGEIHIDYLIHLREVFDEWTRMPIRSNHETTQTGKIYKKWYFNTLTFSQFYELGCAFYPPVESGKSKKVVPAQINDWITPESLAYWFQDDGSRRLKARAFIICTDSFTEGDVDRLIETLKNKFYVDSKKHKKGKCWRIYIPSSSFATFRGLIKPYIVPSMAYKIRD